MSTDLLIFLTDLLVIVGIGCGFAGAVLLAVYFWKFR